MILAVLSAAALVSASRGQPDRDLAGGTDRPDVPARHAAATPNASPVATQLPAGQDVGGRTLPLAPILPDGMVPVTATVTVGGMVRTYDVFSPPPGTAGPVPALVVLQGRKSSVTLEESRDGLIQLAREGKALVVYPVGYRESWNAGACCGAAQANRVDDLSFLTDLIRSIGSRPDVSSVYLVGYSNGGRMAYDIVCAHPKLVSSFVVVAAVPVVGCPAGAPVSLLEMVGTRDPNLTYDSSSPRLQVNGYLEPTVTEQVAAWRKRDGCSTAFTTRTAGTFRLQTWLHCSAKSVVALGTYQGGGHAWPTGAGGLPSGADVLWRFLTTPQATTPLPPSQAPPTTTARLPT